MMLFGVLIALWIIVQGLTSGWNAISQTFKYIGVALLVIAFLKPLWGFWALVLSMGYLDLLKRFLVLGNYTSISDVTIILAFAPFLSVIVFSGILAKDLLSGNMPKDRMGLLIVVIGLGGALSLMVLAGFGGGGLGKLQSLANYAGYVPLIYVVPRLFPTAEAANKMAKRIIILFIPVALYTFKQYSFGLTWWEIAYLETGLSSEARILEGQTFRYFSTLNSSQNLSKIASMVGAMALMVKWGKNKNGFSQHFIKGSLVIMFFVAAVMAGTRSGIIMGLVAILAFYCFRYRFITIALYATGILSILFVIIVSDYVVESKILNELTATMQNKITWLDDERRLNIATLTIRFESFANWKNLDFWKPFGVGDNLGNFVIHDAFTRVIARIGYIPSGLLVIFATTFLVKLHRSILRSVDGRNIKLMGLAIVICIFVGGISASNNLSTFPVNTFLYIFSGFVVCGYQEEKRKKLLKETEARELQDESSDARVAVSS